MNWKKEAEQRLRQYESARCSVGNIDAEIRRLRAALESPGTARADRLVRGGKSREDWMLCQMVQLGELEQRKEQTTRWLQSMDQALSTLTPEEKLLLHRLFICPQKGCVDRLCRELNTERSSVYRKRDAALGHFTSALYGPT